MFVLTFENSKGVVFTKKINSFNLCDATIEGSCIAEENDWELLEVTDPQNPDNI